MAPLPQRALAELLGTFTLVFAAAGSAMAGEGLLGQALANGLVLSVAVAAYGGVSGAHFNPAVTIAFATVGRISWRDAVPYIAAQIVAGTAAAIALGALHSSFGFVAMGAARGAITTPVATIVLGEALITFLLMVAIYGTVIDPRGAGGYDDPDATSDVSPSGKRNKGEPPPSGGGVKIGGFGVGFAVAANILTLGPLTGASMNPARSLGPALVTGDLTHHWCYWIGPTLGALAGAWLYETTLLPAATNDPAETSPDESR